jgi:hypothetical protein
MPSRFLRIKAKNLKFLKSRVIAVIPKLKNWFSLRMTLDFSGFLRIKYQDLKPY